MEPTARGWPDQTGRDTRRIRLALNRRVCQTPSTVSAEEEPETDLATWKSAQRRRDRQDIAAGRRTAEEVQAENAWLIPGDAAHQPIILPLSPACEAL